MQQYVYLHKLSRLYFFFFFKCENVVPACFLLYKFTHCRYASAVNHDLFFARTLKP